MSETEAIYQCFAEAREQAAAEAGERSWKRAMELIKNPKYIEQAKQASRDVDAKQAKMLEQGRNPAECVYDDDYEDDDYDADEWYLDDECYPDDE